ncbi:cyclopropane-fatty-acyl-phospholipid synthase family protein [Kutzneria buriramensis]|uniref:Methyltransferase family protein n=1 Tax=Kutzneria buriramensis TaxID=1045776 RepID=A0A3E0I738_9PSEU|nr:methyltransferase domain-containing protein [Kutzneria buriramensis]REH54447.1 methyltransferase family protein [Kutzneria buriramensis]
MTLPPLHDDLVFHGPMSSYRADLLIRSLGPLDGQHVVDLGCGWAELLLRAVAAGATGHGVDLDAEAIAHGQKRATERGLADRVTLEVGDAGAWSGEADVLIVNGATHVFGGEPTDSTVNTLKAGRRILRPGGRLLLGEGFWEREPTAEQLAVMPMTREEYGSVAELVDLAMEHGYRLLWLSQANQDEWDEFESGHALARERRLLERPDDEEARAGADRQRTWRLKGWRGVLGMVYLTLVVPH